MQTKLKAFRKALGLTQDEVGKAVGASLRQIGSWERDEAEMDLATACKLADFFDCSLDELAGRVSCDDKFGDDASLSLLETHYKSFSAEGRKRLLEQAIMMGKSGMFVKSKGSSIQKTA